LPESWGSDALLHPLQLHHPFQDLPKVPGGDDEGSAAEQKQHVPEHPKGISMRTKNVTRNLPNTLGPEEIDAIATRGAEARQEALQREENLKAYVKEEKGKIEVLWAQHGHAQNVVLARAEERETPCIESYDEETGLIYTTRADTGEKVDERRMAEEDRQTELLSDEEDAD
jgi:hypothetical protein